MAIYQGRTPGRLRKRKSCLGTNAVFLTLVIAACIILVDILSLNFGTVILGNGPNSRSFAALEKETLTPVSVPHFGADASGVETGTTESLSHKDNVEKREVAGTSSSANGEGGSQGQAAIADNVEEKDKEKGKNQERSGNPSPAPTQRHNSNNRNSRSSSTNDRGPGKQENKKVDKIEVLSARLRHTKLLLGKERTVTNSRLTCGGSHTIQWKSYRELRDSFMDKTKLYRHLPENSVSLIDLSKSVQNSTCFKKHRYNYKSNNCTFIPPTNEQGPFDNAELCAVVGNGGRLRQEYHQEEIDSADIVIRFNQGVTQGFEKHVGTKSTIRMFNGPYTSPKQPGEITIAQIREMAIRSWVKAAQKHEGENLAFMFDPDFICHAWDWVGRMGEKPSSGLVGIIMSLRLCKHTNVYGFQFDEYFNTSIRPHYYNWERPKPGRENVHPFAEEKKLYKELEKRGRITLR